jgi:signal transduction histidine kinase
VDVDIQPAILVEGDAALLHIAMTNLLGNAWKYTSKNSQPKIVFGREDSGTLFVKDNGVGFDMSYEQRLFSPFQRGHSSAEFPGTGLGLTIVQRVISRHGGQIWAQSAEKVGTTMFFTLQSAAAPSDTV